MTELVSKIVVVCAIIRVFGRIVVFGLQQSLVVVNENESCYTVPPLIIGVKRFVELP